MTGRLISCLFLLLSINLSAQTALGSLTVEKIMRDPKWIGSSPSNPAWSPDGKILYFDWNPEKADADSLYYITRVNKTPVKATMAEKRALVTSDNVIYSLDRKKFVYSKSGDIFLMDLKANIVKQVTRTTADESNPVFSFNETKIVYTSNQNLFAWDIQNGTTTQLTNFIAGKENVTKKDSGTIEEQWLKNDQLQNLTVLKQRRDKKNKADAYNKQLEDKKELRKIYIEDKNLQALQISPDGRFISYRLIKPVTDGKLTIVPNYVSESGYTEDITARTKVGTPIPSSSFFLFSQEPDTVIRVLTDSIPGIKDLPDYVKDYPAQLEKRMRDSTKRMVNVVALTWSPKGTHAVVDIHAEDNKDRWLMLLETSTGKLKLLDRQRDEAWLAGPGTGTWSQKNNSGWINEDDFWFESEATGYAHLYIINVVSGLKKSLTSGNYEVQDAQLSNDKRFFYLTTNEVHPGEKHFYKLPVTGGKAERITKMTGANEVTISPDQNTLAILYSYSNRPWELYLQENKLNAQAQQITHIGRSQEFLSYPWRDPELITFPARDGVPVYARLYKPAKPSPTKPAVIFVHGAGYLQNAHKWWSDYFREYMFNNMLADNGYYVMDIDYRGSAGYGRDWRTAIYRHMGGKDLDDNVDAANYLVRTFGVDSSRIGIYGGSYGGFIALMALFKVPDAFAAGAALRPVTDWANYNHGYTSNILNEPFNDSIAYRRSTPFYFAEGLKNHLLMCHGMVDVNVHYQDVIKLSQRLIELGKGNWELASFPMEDHGFVDPSSWTDEYKRVYQLFETVLNNR